MDKSSQSVNDIERKKNREKQRGGTGLQGQIEKTMGVGRTFQSLRSTKKKKKKASCQLYKDVFGRE